MTYDTRVLVEILKEENAWLHLALTKMREENAELRKVNRDLRKESVVGAEEARLADAYNAKNPMEMTKLEKLSIMDPAMHLRELGY